MAYAYGRQEQIKLHIQRLVDGESEKQKRSQESESDEFVPCIYTVPNALRNLKPSAYTPRVISIGPLHKYKKDLVAMEEHKDKKHLVAMEEHKVAYMHRLFSRTVHASFEGDNMELTIDKCVKAMLEMVQRARAQYSERLGQWDDIEFAEMMLIDGCFILEHLYRTYELTEPSETAETDKTVHIYLDSLVFTSVKHDLILLENQIPLFVLEKLFELTVEKFQTSEKPFSLKDLVLPFFRNIMNSDRKETMTLDRRAKADHVLDLLHQCYRPASQAKGDQSELRYCATELGRAGVIFVANEVQKGQLDVEFNTAPRFPCLRCPVLFTRTTFKIAPLYVHDMTGPFLRNLIAYEQCHPKVPHYISSYMLVMDTLINTKEDVELLVKSKVLKDNLGSSEDVSNFINSMCKEIVCSTKFYSEQWEKLDKYYEGYWPRHLVTAREKYFSNPWNFIAFVAALVLFALTVTQTVYSIRSA